MPKVKLNTRKLNYNEFKELICEQSQEDRLFEQLKHFEIKHQMSSPVFYEKYKSGQLPDRHEYSVWAAVFMVFSRLRTRGGGSTG